MLTTYLWCGHVKIGDLQTPAPCQLSSAHREQAAKSQTGKDCTLRSTSTTYGLYDLAAETGV